MKTHSQDNAQAISALRDMTVTFHSMVGHWIAIKHDEYNKAMTVLEAAGYHWHNGQLVKKPTPPCTCSAILPNGGWDICPRHG